MMGFIFLKASNFNGLLWGFLDKKYLIVVNVALGTFKKNRLLAYMSILAHIQAAMI